MVNVAPRFVLDTLASWYRSAQVCEERCGRTLCREAAPQEERSSRSTSSTDTMLPAVALAVPCKHRGWLDTFLSPVDVHVDSPESACTSNSSRDGAEQLVHP